MKLEETLRNEQTLVRGELQLLKKCQLQYFILSLGGTGIILGLYQTFSLNNDMRSLLIIAPLLIIIPCWWIFFDKATTITRLVGYTRILEKQLATGKYNYIGYENALSLFRKKEQEYNNSNKLEIRKLLGLLRLKTRHRYWIMNWYTFFFLSLTCILLSLFIVDNSNGASFWASRAVFFMIFILSTIGTLKMISMITIGKYSYDSVYEFWEKHVFTL